MKIVKKVQCKHCNSIVEQNGTCTCGVVIMNEGNVHNAVIGKDYVDISPILLNE